MRLYSTRRLFKNQHISFFWYSSPQRHGAQSHLRVFPLTRGHKGLKTPPPSLNKRKSSWPQPRKAPPQRRQKASRIRSTTRKSQLSGSAGRRSAPLSGRSKAPTAI